MRVRGFSLIELLVAMTLLVLVTLLAYSGLRLGMSYWRTVQQQTDTQQQQRAVRNYLVRQLSAAVQRDEAQREQGLPNLRGNPKRLQLIAPLAAASGRGGLYAIELWSAPSASDPARQSLVMGYRPLQHALQRSTLARQQIALLDNLSELEWAYFGSQSDKGAPRWQGSWQHPDRLPHQLRLRYRDSEWHELRVAVVMADMAADG